MLWHRTMMIMAASSVALAMRKALARRRGMILCILFSTILRTRLLEEFTTGFSFQVVLKHICDCWFFMRRRLFRSFDFMEEKLSVSVYIVTYFAFKDLSSKALR